MPLSELVFSAQSLNGTKAGREMLYLLFLSGLTSFALSLVLTPVFRNLFQRLGLVDQPGGERKVHATPVPRIGGIPLILSLVIGLGLVRLLAPPWIQQEPFSLVWGLLGPAVLVFGLGLADDLYGLRPWQKLLGQTAAAVWAFYLGVHVTVVAKVDVWEWLSLPVTVFWLVLCMNAFNLIDGVDGLAAGLGLFASMTMLAAALLQSLWLLALATVPLAGCLLAFLRYNFNPATVFLGDSGSLLIGFLLGCYGVIWSQKTATLFGLVAPAMALFVPLLDVALTVLRRIVRHQPVFGADRGHIHHKLLERGFTPRRVVLILYAVCVMGALVSLVQMTLQDKFANLVILLFCAAAWMGVQHLGYLEFGVARDMLVGGSFRRLIDGQVQLRRFEAELDAASTVEQCWKALKEGCARFGFAGLRFCVDGQVYEQKPEGNGLGSYWTLRVDLTDRNYLNLIRSHGRETHSPILGPLVDMLRSKLEQKLPSLSWETKRNRFIMASTPHQV